ncbi:hypothetical protein ACFLRN_05195 [Thermoproteota archaeon]
MHPVGYLLITIGLLIVVSAIVFILLSLRRKKVKIIIHDNEKINFSPRISGLQRINYIVRLRHKSKIAVNLKPIAGPFTFFVGDFFNSTVEDPTQRWIFNPLIDAECSPRDEPFNFNFDLEPGNYQFSFHSAGPKSQVTLNTTANFYIRPFEKLLGVGLQLLEVGLPVLITGIVLFFGLQT